MIDHNIIHRVLRAYGIVPKSVVKQTDRLFYASDGKNKYAIKHSRIELNSVHAWQQVYDIAHTKGLRAVLPVYITKKRTLFHIVEDSVFYVTPWLETSSDDNNIAVKSLFESFGYIHETTRQTADVETEQTILKFSAYERQLIQFRERFDQHVEVYEAKHYMSPVELQVCTHYVHLDMIFNMLVNRIRTFTANLKDDKAQTVSLCHGQMSVDHFIYHHKPYVINWEKAHYGHPMNDLAYLLRQVGSRHVAGVTLWKQYLREYFAQYTSTQNERLLLSIYILDPIPYMDAVERYAASDSSMSMIERAHELEQLYRTLRFSLALTDTLDQMVWDGYSDDEAEYRDEI